MAVGKREEGSGLPTSPDKSFGRSRGASGETKGGIGGIRALKRLGRGPGAEGGGLRHEFRRGLELGKTNTVGNCSREKRCGKRAPANGTGTLKFGKSMRRKKG